MTILIHSCVKAKVVHTLIALTVEHEEYSETYLEQPCTSNVRASGLSIQVMFPDMFSLNGFQWKKDRWVHVEKVFDFKLKDGEFPIGN